MHSGLWLSSRKTVCTKTCERKRIKLSSDHGHGDDGYFNPDRSKLASNYQTISAADEVRITDVMDPFVLLLER